jgi:hypothetical protein
LDFTLVRVNQACDRFEESAFSTSRGPDQDYRISLLDFQRNVSKNPTAMKCFSSIFDGDHGRFLMLEHLLIARARGKDYLG